LLSPTSIYLVENVLIFYCETGLVNKRGLSVRALGRRPWRRTSTLCSYL